MTQITAMIKCERKSLYVFRFLVIVSSADSDFVVLDLSIKKNLRKLDNSVNTFIWITRLNETGFSMTSWLFHEPNHEEILCFLFELKINFYFKYFF